MKEYTKNNATIDEDKIIASRRKFLQQMACGSLLTMGGTGVATAAREVIYPGQYGRGHSHLRAHLGQKTFSESLRSRLFRKETSTQARPFYSHTHKMLSFEHTHTGDKLNLTYYEQGNYIKDALNEINYLLRDYHTDDIHPIDPALLDQLFDLKQTLGITKPFHIVSGYRSPFTNAQLRRHNHGVAEHSFHMQGRAIDIRVEGVHTRTIKDAALNMARGGVGYYPRNNFVHLDTGDFRTW
jgi:uncharacterized protein YcbK (DUF882 family)